MGGVAYSGAEMGTAMGGMTGMSDAAMGAMGMTQMAQQVGMTPGMMASMGAAGMAGLDVTSVMTSNVAGLGSEAIQGMATLWLHQEICQQE